MAHYGPSHPLVDAPDPASSAIESGAEQETMSAPSITQMWEDPLEEWAHRYESHSCPSAATLDIP